MTELKIKWQRLVDDSGQTCNRCSCTGDEVQNAVELLQQSLALLGISVVADMMELSTDEFLQSTLESNRVWVAGKPIEDWLKAETAQSQCSGSCGDNVCRTITIGDQEFEVIPKELVLKAGLRAAAELVVQAQ